MVILLKVEYVSNKVTRCKWELARELIKNVNLIESTQC